MSQTVNLRCYYDECKDVCVSWDKYEWGQLGCYYTTGGSRACGAFRWSERPAASEALGLCTTWCSESGTYTSGEIRYMGWRQDCTGYEQDCTTLSKSGTVEFPSGRLNLGGTYSVSTTGDASWRVIAGATKSGNSFRVTAESITLEGYMSGSCYDSERVYLYTKSTQSVSYTGSTSVRIQEPLSLYASATSGLTTFNWELLDSSAGSVTGNLVVFNKIGRFSMRVTQPGNSTWFSASTTFTIEVKKRLQTIEYKGPKDLIVGNVFKLSATSSVGLSSFSYSLDQEGITIVGTTAICSRCGMYKLLVTESGSDVYESATIEVVLVCGIDNFNPVLVVT